MAFFCFFPLSSNKKVGLNFWHATKCVTVLDGDKQIDADRSKKQIDEFNKRILEAESLVIKNSLMTEKVLLYMQSRLVLLENSKMESLARQSQDQAVEVTLELASRPAPAVSEFILPDKYKDAEILADFVDEVFTRVSNGEDLDQQIELRSKTAGGTIVNDIEAERACREWKEKHNVVVGVSWGDLPVSLQKMWMDYSCDQHLDNNNTKVI